MRGKFKAQEKTSVVEEGRARHEGDRRRVARGYRYTGKCGVADAADSSKKAGWQKQVRTQPLENMPLLPKHES